MNETLDWSWRGMNGNFNFGDCCDGYGGLHAAAVLLFSLCSLSTTGVQETFQRFLFVVLCSFPLHYNLPFQLRFSSCWLFCLLRCNWKTNLFREIELSTIIRELFRISWMHSTQIDFSVNLIRKSDFLDWIFGFMNMRIFLQAANGSIVLSCDNNDIL